MALWLLFYFVILPWIVFLCVLGRRPPANGRERTKLAVVYGLSLALHAALLAWVAVVGLALAYAWGNGRIAPLAAFCSGFLLACLGHAGVLFGLARPVSRRFRLGSVVAVPAGWLLAIGVTIAAALSAAS